MSKSMSALHSQLLQIYFLFDQLILYFQSQITWLKFLFLKFKNVSIMYQGKYLQKSYFLIIILLLFAQAKFFTPMQHEIDFIWQQFRRKLPFGRSQHAQKRRAQIFKQIDTNNDGYLSESEIRQKCITVLKLPPSFRFDVVIKQAFEHAKNKLKSRTKYGQDKVSKAQFPYFLQYIRHYYEYWVAFRRMDITMDKGINKQEFINAIPMMQKWGITIYNPEQTFKSIDLNHGGIISFNEFCKWAMEVHLDIEDDDDYDNWM